MPLFSSASTCSQIYYIIYLSLCESVDLFKLSKLVRFDYSSQARRFHQWVCDFISVFTCYSPQNISTNHLPGAWQTSSNKSYHFTDSFKKTHFSSYNWHHWSRKLFQIRLQFVHDGENVKLCKMYRCLDLILGRVAPTWEDHEFSLCDHWDGELSCLDSELVEWWSVFSISHGEAEPTRFWAWDQTQAIILNTSCYTHNKGFLMVPCSTSDLSN